MTESRTVLISGTSSGIGLAAAVACGRAGWTVIATMRDTAKSEALTAAAQEAGVEVDVRALDVTDPRSISECLGGSLAEHGHLDALVNNAGAAYVGTLENDDVADLRACMEVNFFGVVALSQAAMLHLRASRGRLLTVSSVGGAVGQPFNEAYCAAKFAVEGFMQSLAPVAGSVGVSVGVVEPGAVASSFVANAGLDVPTMLERAGPYAPAMQHYIERTLAQFDPANAQTSAAVGDIIADLLDVEELPFRTQTTDRARDFVGRSLADLDGSAVLAETGGWVG